jgi:hypothetical protein
MKLRVRGNSIRLRVSPDDLDKLLGSGLVEDSVSFPGGQMLRYRLEATAGPEPGAELAGTAIVVRFPENDIARWARSEEVAMRAERALADGSPLRVLVEKDFECLAPRDDDGDGALFPNPKAASERP